MPRTKLVCVSLTVFTASATVLLAQAPVDSILWFDIRDNAAGGPQTIFGGKGAKSPWINGDGDGVLPFTAPINVGGPGGGQILRLSPTTSNNMHHNDAYAPGITAWANYDGDGLLSTGSLFLYWTVNPNNDTTPGVNDVITSLGININSSQIVAGGTRNQMASLSFEIFNSGVAGVPSGSPWNNKNDGTLSGFPPLLSWTGAKAVRIPVTSGPTFDPTLGLTPSTTPYRVGRLRVTAGQRNCAQVREIGAHAQKSSYAFNLQVNNLLITRAFSAGGDSPHNEKIAFGYTATGEAELANASGGVQNASSTVPDAIVQIRLKGDSNGDGYVNAADIAAFWDAINANSSGLLTVEQTYLYDFTNDRAVNAGDIAGMNAAITLSIVCP